MPRGSFFWTDELTDRACALVAEGWTADAIGRALGITRNAVIGRMKRLRDLGDPRAPAVRPNPAGATSRYRQLGPLDAVAEVMADGCPSLSAAAEKLRLPLIEVRRRWDVICAGLGPQA